MPVEVSRRTSGLFGLPNRPQIEASIGDNARGAVDFSLGANRGVTVGKADPKRVGYQLRITSTGTEPVAVVFAAEPLRGRHTPVMIELTPENPLVLTDRRDVVVKSPGKDGDRLILRGKPFEPMTMDWPQVTALVTGDIRRGSRE